MKKVVRVVVEKEMEIEIADFLLTEAAVKEFSEIMFNVTDVGDLFKFAAATIVTDGERFVEGLGKASVVYSAQPDPVKYKVLLEEEDVEILEENEL